MHIPVLSQSLSAGVLLTTLFAIIALFLTTIRIVVVSSKNKFFIGTTQLFKKFLNYNTSHVDSC